MVTQSEVEIEAALVSLANDLGAETVLEIVDLYLAEGPRHVTEMRAAADAGDATVLRRSAHTLKSTSATVGAQSLNALCMKVEHLAKELRVNEAREYLDDLATEEAAASAIVHSLKSKLAAQVA